MLALTAIATADDLEKALYSRVTTGLEELDFPADRE
jgi:hypothetical protein